MKLMELHVALASFTVLRTPGGVSAVLHRLLKLWMRAVGLDVCRV